MAKEHLGALCLSWYTKGGAASHQLFFCLPGLGLPVPPVVLSVIPGISAPDSVSLPVPVMSAVAAVLPGPVSVSLPLPIKMAFPFAIPAQNRLSVEVRSNGLIC